MDKFLESLTYKYSIPWEPFIQLKSWMAINPSYGCSMDCAYCIQEKDKFFVKTKNRIKQEITIEEITKRIESNVLISKNVPLVLYNFSDPFFKENLTDLKNILFYLEKNNFKNFV